MSAQPLPASGSSAFPSGAVTGTAHPGTAWPEPAAPPASRRSAPRLLWFGLAAAVVLAGGLALVLVLTVGGRLGSGRGPFGAAPPPDVRPPLARLCPAPTATEPEPTATPGPTATPPASGPRTVDETAGISYRAYGEPWQPWPYLWRMGTLSVPYGVGQFFVTETYSGGQERYLASLLSAAVPAAVNDSTAIDLECTGRQVAADVRAEYYPRPNQMDLLRDERTTLGGRPAWVTKFRMHFEQPGLKAKDELVSVALIDVGRPTAAVLYVSIPGTHPQWNHVVDEVLVSVRPL